MVLLENKSQPARKWRYVNMTGSLKTRGAIHLSPEGLSFLASMG